MIGYKLKQDLNEIIALLCCPISKQHLTVSKGGLVTEDNEKKYEVSEQGIPLFAKQFCSEEARLQENHYDKVSESYINNLNYPHTQEYMRYLDEVFLKIVDEKKLDNVAEICCGHGETMKLLESRIERCIGIDVSLSMLEHARAFHNDKSYFIQGDATLLPIKDQVFDSVFMLGGIHHVVDRTGLFKEIHRILKPGGVFYYREPVSDFFLWRAIRWMIYRISPALEHNTERPLLYKETVPILEGAQLQNIHWNTHGFIGFCMFMNSDILIFNRLFRFFPGIRHITNLFTKVDELILRIPTLHGAGLQVVGAARRNESETYD